MPHAFFLVLIKQFAGLAISIYVNVPTFVRHSESASNFQYQPLFRKLTHSLLASTIRYSQCKSVTFSWSHFWHNEMALIMVYVPYVNMQIIVIKRCCMLFVFFSLDFVCISENRENRCCRNEFDVWRKVPKRLSLFGGHI